MTRLSLKRLTLTLGWHLILALAPHNRAGNSTLDDHINDEKLKEAVAFLKNPSNVKPSKEQTIALLCLACKEDVQEAVRYILEDDTIQGKDYINEKDDDGKNLLWHLIADHNIVFPDPDKGGGAINAILGLLLDNGIDTTVKDNENRTFFEVLMAYNFNHTKANMIHTLLIKGHIKEEIRGNKMIDGKTLLQVVCRASNVEIIQLLLADETFNVNQAINDQGDTLLHWCVRDKQEDILKEVLQRADIDLYKANGEQQTAIRVALEKLQESSSVSPEGKVTQSLENIALSLLAHGSFDKAKKVDNDYDTIQQLFDALKLGEKYPNIQEKINQLPQELPPIIDKPPKKPITPPQDDKTDLPEKNNPWTTLASIGAIAFTMGISLYLIFRNPTRNKAVASKTNARRSQTATQKAKTK